MPRITGVSVDDKNEYTKALIYKTSMDLVDIV